MNIYYGVLSLLIGILVYIILNKIINKVIKINIVNVDEGKKKTIVSLIRNVIKYILIIIEIVIVLKIFNINTTTIVASIGIMGAVIGLAFQDLLKDLIAGIFIIVEDQYRIGEVVVIDNFKGKVIFLGLKSTKIQSVNKEIKIIPNGKILNVINHSRDKTKVVINITTNIENKASIVEKTIDKVMTEIIKDKENIGCEYIGITKLNNANITYSIKLLTNKEIMSFESNINKIIVNIFNKDSKITKKEVEVTYE